MTYYLYVERDGEVEFLAESNKLEAFTDLINDYEEYGLYEGFDYKAVNVITREEYMFTDKWEPLDF